MTATTPCDACYAPCCREPRVVLSGREALRIAESRSLLLLEFVQFSFREQLEGDHRIALFDPEAKRRRYSRMELRQIETPDERHRTRCYFLATEGGLARCSCYPVRPRPCIAFPYLERGLDVALSRLSKQWCPKDAWAGVAIDGPGHHRLRREQESERAEYDAIIDTWNARAVMEHDPETWSVASFARYLERAYAPSLR